MRDDLRCTGTKSRMKAADFVTWVERMKTRGKTQRDIAETLGCGVNQITAWKRINPPRYIGLAISAHERKLKVWTAKGRKA